jgi:hypothetical protein
MEPIAPDPPAKDARFTTWKLGVLLLCAGLAAVYVAVRSRGGPSSDPSAQSASSTQNPASAAADAAQASDSPSPDPAAPLPPADAHHHFGGSKSLIVVTPQDVTPLINPAAPTAP